MRKLLSFIFFISIILLGVVVAQTTNPWSSNPTGAEKNEFTNLQDVYLKSTALCAPNTKADVYVVTDKQQWSVGDLLIDVRTSGFQTTDLLDGKIPLKKIWSNPSSGSYDIIVDCNSNGQYDLYVDQVDSISAVGFKVTAVAGKGKAALSEREIKDDAWMYDSEESNLDNDMFEITLSSEGENIDLKNITIQAGGTGNDTEIAKIGIYVDGSLIGSAEPAYLEDDGITMILPSIVIEEANPKNLLIVYSMKETTPEGNYKLSVTSVYGEGLSSGKSIQFSGLPLNSATKTVLPKKTCLGQIVLNLEPSPVDLKAEVAAKITGLTGCQSKKIILRPNPCASSLTEELCSAVSGDDAGTCNFTALKGQTVYACIDKNQDGDMVDFGEYTLKDLLLTQPVEKEKGNFTEMINITEGINETGKKEGITGGIIAELKEKISGTSSLFILLEITLLLILLVLVVIMVRLKSSRRIETTQHSQESQEKTHSQENKSEEQDKTKRKRRIRRKETESQESVE